MTSDADVVDKLQRRGAISQRAHERSTRQHEAVRSLILIRHGTTHLNSEDVSVDRIRGHGDPPLSDEGRKDAKVLAGKLRGRDRPDVLVTSDLKRAAETAHIIAKATGIRLLGTDKCFRPWDVGKYTGTITKDALPHLHRYACEDPDTKVPDGESFNSFKRRFFEGLEELLQRCKPTITPGIVSHYRNQRLLASWEAEGCPTDGTIDLAEFVKKGDPPGTVDRYSLAPARIAAVAHLR